MSPTNARISVVIPTYNHARFLPESIESALRQTLQPCEVIVVDDGSTDETSELVSRYPVRYLRPGHAGISSARNTGIRESKGDWIAFLDSDDYWLPGKLESQMAAIRDEAFCYCATTMFFTDGHTEPRAYHDAASVKKVLRHHNCLDTSAVLVRKELLVQVGGFNETISAAEDWEVWLKLARLCEFVGIPEKLLMYRVTGTGLSTKPEVVLESIEAVVKAGTSDLPPVRRFIEARRMRSVRTALAALKYRDLGDYSNTLRYALRAFGHWPSPFYDKAFKLLALELARRVKRTP